jgi:anti-sigma factor RsiW
MSEHLTEETIMLIADGEEADSAHVSECARCANALVEAMQLKRAVRDVMGGSAARFSAPSRMKPSVTRYLAIAATAAFLMLLGAAFIGSRQSATRELVDLHTTIVGSANPIDVLSTDRHTVKPWFEGKVPFAVNVPELGGTPFRLVGGRVAFWRGRPVAYLLLAKGAHKVSLFVMNAEGAPNIGPMNSMTIESWRANGLRYISVSDLPRGDVEQLKAAFQ